MLLTSALLTSAIVRQNEPDDFWRAALEVNSDGVDGVDDAEEYDPTEEDDALVEIDDVEEEGVARLAPPSATSGGSLGVHEACFPLNDNHMYLYIVYIFNKALYKVWIQRIFY